MSGTENADHDLRNRLIDDQFMNRCVVAAASGVVLASCVLASKITADSELIQDVGLNFSFERHTNKVQPVIMEKPASTQQMPATDIANGSSKSVNCHDGTSTEYTPNFIDICTSGKLPTDEDQPKKGLKFKVAYIDTMPDATDDVQVAVALHGTPGKSQHFTNLLQKLHDKNIRVIAPDFPGWGSTPMDSDHEFSHTPQERASFLTDFLQALNIRSVDVLVAHSSSAYLTYYLCKHSPQTLKSVVMVNPGTHNIVTMLQPTWLSFPTIKLSGSAILRPIINPLMRFVSSNYTSSQLNPEEWLRGGRALVAVDYNQVRLLLQDLAKSDLPLALVVSKDDKMISINDSLEMAAILGLSKDNLTVINKEGKATSQGISKSERRYTAGYLLENGTHFCMKTHPDLLVKVISDIAHHVRSRHKE